MAEYVQIKSSMFYNTSVSGKDILKEQGRKNICYNSQSSQPCMVITKNHQCSEESSQKTRI